MDYEKHRTHDSEKFTLMAAMNQTVKNLLENVYTNKPFSYLASKLFDYKKQEQVD